LRNFVKIRNVRPVNLKRWKENSCIKQSTGMGIISLFLFYISNIYLTFCFFSLSIKSIKQKPNYMCKPEFRKDLIRKRFFRTNNPLLIEASKVMNQLYGSNEERLGQLEMVVQTEEFRRKYPGLIGKDVAAIVRSQLV